MSPCVPVFLLFSKRQDDQSKTVLLMENKSEVVELTDGRKIHLLVENPASLKPPPAPLTEEQKRFRRVLGIAVLFLILAVSMVCFLFDSLQ